MYYLLQMMMPLLLCRQQGEEPTKIHMECGTAGETSMPPLKYGCFGSAALLFAKYSNSCAACEIR